MYRARLLLAYFGVLIPRHLRRRASEVTLLVGSVIIDDERVVVIIIATVVRILHLYPGHGWLLVLLEV